MNDNTTSDDDFDEAFDDDEYGDDRAYRVRQALHRGDLDDVCAGLAQAPGVTVSLTPNQQAEWLIAAIDAPTHSSALLAHLLEAGLDPSAVYDEIGSLPESWSLPREVIDLYREHRRKAP